MNLTIWLDVNIDVGICLLVEGISLAWWMLTKLVGVGIKTSSLLLSFSLGCAKLFDGNSSGFKDSTNVWLGGNKSMVNSSIVEGCKTS